MCSRLGRRLPSKVGRRSWRAGLALDERSFADKVDLVTKDGHLQAVGGIPVPKESRLLFQAAARVHLGDGKNTLFWEDRWLMGSRIQELAPRLYDRIPARVNK